MKLRTRARALKAQLPAERFSAHREVKLVAAVRRAITDTVPQDPSRSDFWLRANLAKFRRLKGYGLPDRYRLFFAFSSAAKTIIYLYLNDSATLRKDGAATDPYEIFAGLLVSGQIGADFEATHQMAPSPTWPARRPDEAFRRRSPASARTAWPPRSTWRRHQHAFHQRGGRAPF